MNKYKISIILPIYNTEKYLKLAIDSVINQTIGFENIELIIINDGSTDNSKFIIDKYDKSYTNIIAIHFDTKSGSAGRPRNYGLEIATSDYIMFIDPDDYYEKTACEILYNKIIRNDYDLVIGSHNLIQNDKVIDTYYPLNVKEDKKIDSIDQETNLINIHPAIWGKIFKKKIIMENHIVFPEKILGQDLVFYINYLLISTNIVIIPNIITNYRLRKNEEDQSVSYICNKKYFNDMNECQKLCKDLFKKYEKSDYYKLLQSGSIIYYTKRLVHTNKLSVEEKMDIFKEMNWFYSTCDISLINSDDKCTYELVKSIKAVGPNENLLFSFAQNMQLSILELNNKIGLLNYQLKESNSSLKNRFCGFLRRTRKTMKKDSIN